MPVAIRWKRSILVGVLATATVAAFVVLPSLRTQPRQQPEPTAAEPRPLVVTDQDQAAILRVLLHSGGIPGLPSVDDPEYRHEVVLNSRSVMTCRSELAMPTGKSHAVCPQSSLADWILASNASGIALKFRQELVWANRVPRLHPDPQDPDVVFWRETVDPSLDEPRAGEPMSAQLRRRKTLVGATRAVRSTDGTRALIYMEYSCGGLCGMGAVYELKRDGIRWTITVQNMLWIS